MDVSFLVLGFRTGWPAFFIISSLVPPSLGWLVSSVAFTFLFVQNPLLSSLLLLFFVARLLLSVATLSTAGLLSLSAGAALWSEFL